MRYTTLMFAAAASVPSVPAAQIDINWHTIDCGGGSTSNGTLVILGTIGQFDTSSLSLGTLTIAGGFWSIPSAACYANCDGSTIAPILNANDFQCFLNAFAASQSYANCDGSTIAPVLNANDFQCFLNQFAAGCS